MSCDLSLPIDARLRLVATEFLLAVRRMDISFSTSLADSLKYDPGPGEESEVA